MQLWLVLRLQLLPTMPASRLGLLLLPTLVMLVPLKDMALHNLPIKRIILAWINGDQDQKSFHRE